MLRLPDQVLADKSSLAASVHGLRHVQAQRSRTACQSRSPSFDGFNDRPPGPSRLIIPGQDSGPRPSGQLVMPGNNSGTQTGPLQRQNFRPPPGFMDAVKPENGHAKEPELPPQEMLSRLRANSGQWYKLAEYLPLLMKAGYDAAGIENETGLERPKQNMWSVSAQVHASLVSSGDMGAVALHYFDQEDADQLLYELRFLELALRPAAATYIAQKELGSQDCSMLSRAIRDHLRRNAEKEGFSMTPGDCLAYKHFRDAIEARKESAKKACMERGLAVAETEAAKAAIRKLDEEAVADKVQTSIAPQLQVVRMTGEEMSFRPVPLAGDLESATPASLAAAPQTRQAGVFHAFEAAGGAGQRWVVLPAWHSLMVARRPLALYVSNCQQVPAIVAAVRPRTEEDRMRLSGPALLLADTDPVDELEPDDMYLVAVTDTGLGIAPGRDCSKEAVCARVLMCCRPPTRSMPQAASSSALMQL